MSSFSDCTEASERIRERPPKLTLGGKPLRAEDADADDESTEREDDDDDDDESVDWM